jgi:hypothetical protein
MWIPMSPEMYADYSHLSKMQFISPQHATKLASSSAFSTSHLQYCTQCHLPPGYKACTCCGRYGKTMYPCRRVRTVVVGRLLPSCQCTCTNDWLVSNHVKHLLLPFYIVNSDAQYWQAAAQHVWWLYPDDTIWKPLAHNTAATWALPP